MAGGGFAVCRSGCDGEGRYCLRLRRVGGQGCSLASLSEEHHVYGVGCNGVGMFAGGCVWF